MKNTLIALFLSTAIAAPAFADSQVPLVVKRNALGYVHVDWFTMETCELYADHVVITKQFGRGEAAYSLIEDRKVSVGSAIHQAIARAAQATLDERDNTMCDGPSTTILANRILPDGTADQALLYSTGGCGAARKERQGADANHLRDLANRFCPVNHDFAL